MEAARRFLMSTPHLSPSPIARRIDSSRGLNPQRRTQAHLARLAQPADTELAGPLRADSAPLQQQTESLQRFASNGMQRTRCWSGTTAVWSLADSTTVLGIGTRHGPAWLALAHALGFALTIQPLDARPVTQLSFWPGLRTGATGKNRTCD